LLTISNGLENVVPRNWLDSIDFIGSLADNVRIKIESVPVSPHVFQQKGLRLAYCGAFAPALDDLEIGDVRLRQIKDA
jgi:hypothetical protein